MRRRRFGLPNPLPIYGGRRAWLRYAWWTFARRYFGELCQDCGRPYIDTIYRVPDDVWDAFHGSANLLCPRCLSRRADKAGVMLVWTVTE